MKYVFSVSFLLFSIVSIQAQSAKISVAELPTAARTFLNEYYKYRPIEFVKKKDKTAIPYQVKLAQGTQICFAENGEWCTVDGDGSSLPKELIPQNITDFVKAKYPRKRITYIEKDANRIGVNLNNKVGLEFDAKGNPL
ncbi:PepSY-like domain-containing protein [Flavobacterium sp. MAH-1]|uniref:PepSY-like domain-containing protein n=1 Tax=Flavobacterium agri TaxID=2743471 RepID=A0A7Y9C665_9FLAO|nr:PepSY-like domain-containing protein [Flavobacterium agri]NUY82037.1 PepSY-like domain-containing protein [Flavobacterium agri]NYA72061.1 PepSY-like domain-containing protein [Flavobacterium agri]